MKNISVIIFIIFTALNCEAQSKKIDSLKLILSQVNNDTTKIRLLNKVGSSYAEIKNDSALIYFKEALEISEETGDIRN